MMKQSLISLLALLLFVACGGPAASVEDMDAQLTEVFDQLTDESTGLLDPDKSRAFLEQVQEFSANSGDKEAVSSWLFKSAEIAQGIGDYAKSLALYEQILKEYPDTDRAPDATFMIAFTYDENFKDYDQARLYYEQFLENYPEDDFADDAELMLELLGKSDEEVLESLGH